MKSWTLIIACLLIIGCGKAPSPTQHSTTLTDATGEAVPLKPFPSRIVSFAPAITQNIYLLKEQVKLVGVTKYCKLPSGEDKPRIGDLLTQDVEQIILLKPDLVMASQEGNQPEFAYKLRKLGIRVFVLPEAKTWADIQNAFQQTGKLLGKQEETTVILSGLNRRLEAIRQKNAVNNNPIKVFIQLSEELHTAAEDTFLDDAINQAGAINIAHNTLGRWPILSIEKVINENPDLIIISSMGEFTGQATAMWSKFPALTAVKNNKIKVIDADICCQPTPDNFVRLVEIISGMLKQ
jgi:iron complex transport system substrate-binding protein